MFTAACNRLIHIIMICSPKLSSGHSIKSGAWYGDDGP